MTLIFLFIFFSYRYHIHQYNVDSLILSMLPYHESKIFVRVVQLLKLNSKTATKWDWLEEMQVCMMVYFYCIILGYSVLNTIKSLK